VIRSQNARIRLALWFTAKVSREKPARASCRMMTSMIGISPPTGTSGFGSATV